MLFWNFVFAYSARGASVQLALFWRPYLNSLIIRWHFSHKMYPYPTWLCLELPSCFLASARFLFVPLFIISCPVIFIAFNSKELEWSHFVNRIVNMPAHVTRVSGDGWNRATGFGRFEAEICSHRIRVMWNRQTVISQTISCRAMAYFTWTAASAECGWSLSIQGIRGFDEIADNNTNIKYKLQRWNRSPSSIQKIHQCVRTTL